MSGAIIAAIVQLAGLAGVRLSPFWAGAAVAGVLALLAGGMAVATGVHLYDAGYEAADSAWQAKALEAQLAAARADLAEAGRAAIDAAARAAKIKQTADQEKAGTDSYVEQLKAENAALAARGKPGAYALTCDDLRGMRIASKACPGAAGAPAADVPGGVGGKRRRPVRRIE